MKNHSNLNPVPERKQPTQARSQRIVDAIVLAAQKILSEEGSCALNTNYVAKVAGVNIASLYRWFPNKEAIIEGLFEELLREEMSQLLELLKQHNDLQLQAEIMSVKQVLSLIIDTTIMRHQRFLSLHKSYYQQNLDSFNFAERGVLDTNHTWIEMSDKWLATFVREHRPGLTCEEASFRAYIVTRAVQGVCLSAATDQPELLGQKRFRQRLFSLAEGQLQLE